MTIKLHHLKPAPGARTEKTRVGRGEGSKGKTAGRGTKGTKARYQVPASFEGGQMPIHMRMRKMRGPNKKMSMPFEPFRTHTQPVNLSDLNLFEDGAEVTPETLRERGLARRKRVPVKVLAKGELERKNLTISAHGFSAAAKEKIEAAGGTCTLIETESKAAKR